MSPVRRSKRVSASTNVAENNVVTTPLEAAHISPLPQSRPTITRSTRKTTREESPIKRVKEGRMTKKRKQALAENLELEIAERTRKLRSQYSQQAHALRQRIEMRINRVPKKLWKMKMGDLITQAEGKDVATSMAGFGGVKGFVDDIRSQSRIEIGREAHLTVAKQKSPKKPPVPSARKRMPPPPMPSSPAVSRSSKAIPLTSSSIPSSPVHQTYSPATRQASKPTRSGKGKAAQVGSPVTRPRTRPATRSSTGAAFTAAENILEASSASKRGARSSQPRSKAQSGATSNPSLKRGGAKGTGSNGSLKENKVAGVRKEAGTKSTNNTANKSRVLRSR